MLRSSGCQYIYRIGNRRTWIQFRFQHQSLLPFYFRYMQTTLRQSISQHHCRSSCMGYNSKISTINLFQRKNTRNRCQIFSTETTHYSCFPEKRFDSQIRTGHSPSMRRCCPTSRLGRTRFDSRNFTPFPNQ